jgi:hypothetical protein
MFFGFPHPTNLLRVPVELINKYKSTEASNSLTDPFRGDGLFPIFAGIQHYL